MGRERIALRKGALGAGLGLCLAVLLAAVLPSAPAPAQDTAAEQRRCAQALGDFTRAQQELRIVHEMIEQFGGGGAIEFSAADNARNLFHDMVMHSVSYFSPLSYSGRYNLTQYHLDHVDAALAKHHDDFVQAVQAQHPLEYRLLAPLLIYGPDSTRGRHQLADALGIAWRPLYIEDRDAFLRAALDNAEMRRKLYNRFDANPAGARRYEASLTEDMTRLGAHVASLNCKTPEMPPGRGDDPIVRNWTGTAPWTGLTFEKDDGGFFTSVYGQDGDDEGKGEITLVKINATNYRGIFHEGSDWPDVTDGQLTVTLLPDGHARVVWSDDRGRAGEENWR